MIFIIANTYKDAKKWAVTQQLACDEWFATLDEDELLHRKDFHTIVLDTASELPSPLFERLFSLGQKRGRMKNDNNNHPIQGRSHSDTHCAENELDTIGPAKGYL